MWLPTGFKKSDYTRKGLNHTFGSIQGSWGSSDPSTNPPVAVPAPTIDNAEIAAEQNSDMLRRRMGRASTILSGQSGTEISSQNVASKILLGM